MNKLVQSLHYLLNCISLSAIFLHILNVNFLIKLLLHVKRVGLAVDDFECLLLRIADFTLDHLLELVKLFHNVCLTFVECGLNLA